MSTDELAGIVPLVSVFCALFSHVLTLMHDVEFFEDHPTGTSIHPSVCLSLDRYIESAPLMRYTMLALYKFICMCVCMYPSIRLSVSWLVLVTPQAALWTWLKKIKSEEWLRWGWENETGN